MRLALELDVMIGKERMMTCKPKGKGGKKK